MSSSSPTTTNATFNSGGIADREAMLRQKMKKTAQLDPLRDQVKQLEQNLISSRHSKHLGVVTKTKRRLVLADDGEGEKNDDRATSPRYTTEQVILAPKSFVRSVTTSAVSKIQGSSFSNSNTTTATDLSELERNKYSFAGAVSSAGASPYRHYQLQREGVVAANTRDGQQEHQQSAERGVTLTHPLAGIDSRAVPLPMVGDSVFRDGLVGALMSEGGWSADQALAALVATQRQGTLAAAKNWLRTVLVSGNASTSRAVKNATTQSSEELRILRGGKQVDDDEAEQRRRRRDSDGGATDGFTRSAPLLSALASPFADPPQPPARAVHGSGLSSTTNSLTLYQSSQQQQQQQSNNNNRSLLSLSIGSDALVEEQHKDDLVRLPPIGAGRTPLLTSTQLRQQRLLEEQQKQDGGGENSPRNNMNNNSNSNANNNSVLLGGGVNVFEPKIRIRVRRPTDGVSVELRRRFSSQELLSSIFLAFLQEQAEDATNLASSVDAQKAASFARLVSATASKWALVGSSGRVWTWEIADRTTLSDAGVGALGALFVMKQVTAIARAAKAAEKAVSSIYKVS